MSKDRCREGMGVEVINTSFEIRNGWHLIQGADQGNTIVLLGFRTLTCKTLELIADECLYCSPISASLQNYSHNNKG